MVGQATDKTAGSSYNNKNNSIKLLINVSVIKLSIFSEFFKFKKTPIRETKASEK